MTEQAKQPETVEAEAVNDPGLRARIEAKLAQRRAEQGQTSSKSGKKGGRKKAASAPPPPPEEPELDIEAATMAFSPVAFGLIKPFADRLDPSNPYTLDEAATLTRAVLVVGQKYPDFDYIEEFTLVAIIAAQLGGRYLMRQNVNVSDPGAEYDRSN